jgi:hypothetical protein
LVERGDDGMLGMPIEIVSGAYWLEIVSWICQIFLTILAFFAAWFAYVQILQIKSDSAQQLRMSHASIFLAIDQRWDNDMREARTVLAEMTDDIAAIVKLKNPTLKGAGLRKAIRKEWFTTLNGMRHQRDSSYMNVLAVCGFFETVGLMVKKNYVSAKDVIGLLKAAILQVDYYLRPHIEARAKEKGVPEGLFEHAIYLCDLAKNA